MSSRQSVDCQVKEIIQDLQTLKRKQLIQLHRFPACSEEDLSKNINEIVERSSHTIDALKSLRLPRMRLLGKLAFDFAELSLELSTASQTQLQKRVKRDFYLHGDEFLMHKIPMHPLLRDWYKELKNIALRQGEHTSGDCKSTFMKDKEVFNIKFDPFCSRCKELLGFSEPVEYPVDRSHMARLSFSTCHNGFCCRITLESICRLCKLQSSGADVKIETSEWTEDVVHVNVDPYFCEEAILVLNEHTGITASQFIHNHIWTWIENCCMLK